ncbi:MAG TPA: PAS domain S-box protein, partial [Anaerolineaceae bacterium]|nr:PAS domain S-box protein [Anaerolineaceae bacterium]
MNESSSSRKRYEQGMPKEMDALAERLTKSEASLAALLAGEIDAILDPATSSPLLLHQAQAALVESHRLLELIYNNLNVSLAFMDPDFNFIRVNQAYAVNTGMPPSAFVGKNHFDLFPSEEVKAIFTEVVKSGQPYKRYSTPFSNLLHPEDGPTYWDWTLHPLEDPQGKVTGLLLVLVDVTVQKRAELALQKRTVQLQLLHDIAVASNEAESVEGILQYAIDRMCSFTGWPVGHALVKDPSQGLISTHLWHLQPGVDWGPFREVSERANWTARVGLPGKVLATAAPIWIEDLDASSDFTRAEQARIVGLKSMFAFPALIASEPVGVVEFYCPETTPVDSELLNLLSSLGAQLGRVIERVRSRQAVQRSEALFRAIFEKSALGIQVNDPQGNFIESNLALQRMLGYSAEELRHLGLTEVTHPGDLDRVWMGIKKLLRGESDQVHAVTRYVCKDGSLVWAQQVSSLVRDAMGPQYLITLVDDITDQRRMEIELAELQRRLFDSVETERQRLAAELHDGPLQDLYGASFQLLDVLPDLQESEHEGAVANAQAIVQHV